MFTMKCNCGIVYNPKETNDKCSDCKLHFAGNANMCFDTDSFINKIYDMCNDSSCKENIAIFIFDTYWNLYNRFDVMDDIALKLDPAKMSIQSMICILSSTFKYADQVKNHKIFYDKVKLQMINLNESEERITKLLKGLDFAGNYWDDMKKYGAPEWLSGPIPK
jgi:hypothetical protein